MNRYLISAAALALLAAPALAQQDDHRGGDHPGGGGGHEHAAPAAAPAAPAAAPAAPAAAPQAPRGNGPNPNNGGGFANANRAMMGNANANRAQPNTPQAAQDNRGGGDRRDFSNANRALMGNADANRGNDNRGNDNRGNFRDNRGNDNHADNNRGYRPGNNRDFSSFRDFHRTFRAPQRFHAPAYRRPPGYSYRRWSYGDILPALFWGQQYWLSNYDNYDLPPPPYGTTWVRYGDDALLIDRYSGEIITVEYGVFY